MAVLCQVHVAATAICRVARASLRSAATAKARAEARTCGMSVPVLLTRSGRTPEGKLIYLEDRLNSKIKRYIRRQEEKKN